MRYQQVVAGLLGAALLFPPARCPARELPLARQGFVNVLGGKYFLPAPKDCPDV